MVDVETEFIPPDVKYPWLDRVYNRVAHVVHDYHLEFIGQILGQRLLTLGYDAMFFPTKGVHPDPTKDKTSFQIWRDSAVGKYGKYGWTHGPFSHRHAATRAGIAEFGYNNLILTREFGDRVRINTVVTNAELDPDPLISKPICLRGKCGFVCIKACFMGAITRRDDPSIQDYRSVESIDDSQIFVDTPARTIPQKCMSRRSVYPHSPVRGDCMRVCPIGAGKHILHDRLQKMVDAEKGQPLRKYDHDYN